MFSVTNERLHVRTELLGALGILFAAGAVLFVTQLALGATNPENWFSRVYVAGMGGIFTTALLWRITEKSSWSLPLRVGSAVINLVLSVVLLLGLTTIVWMAA